MLGIQPPGDFALQLSTNQVFSCWQFSQYGFFGAEASVNQMISISLSCPIRF
jgi:hypothetical protein